MAAARMRAGAPHAKARKITHNKDWLIANLVGQSRDQRMLAALADVDHDHAVDHASGPATKLL